MFNKLPKHIHMISSCSVYYIYKSQLDKLLRKIYDLHCHPGYNNSLDGGDCLNEGHYADALAANLIRIVSCKDKRQVMPVVVPSYTIT